MINQEETALIEQEISTLPAAPVIENQNDLDAASLVLRRIKGIKNAIEERKKQITKPLMDSLSSVRELFRKYEDGAKAAEASFKAAILSYEATQDANRAQIAAGVADGTVDLATAIESMEKPDAPKGISSRTVTKVRVIDEKLIPRDYLEPNMKLIVEAVLKQGLTIAGVEKYEEKQLAVRA